MAVAARYLSHMGVMRVGFQGLCPYGNVFVTLVTRQARLCFRGLGRAISMTYRTGQPHFAVRILYLPGNPGT